MPHPESQAAEERPVSDLARLRAKANHMHYSIESVLLLAAAAVAGGAVNALAGGGTLITFPALVASGLQDITANITNTVGLLPGYGAGAWAQRKDLAGQGTIVWLVIIPAMVGGCIGAILLLATGKAIFKELVPWLILLATGLLALEPIVKRRVTARLAASGQTAKISKPGMIAAAFVGAIYGGYFGAGLGIILLALYSFAIPDSLTRINALKQMTSVPANFAAAAIFVQSGSIAWWAAAIVAAGAIVGGTLGGQFAGRVPANYLRGVIIVLGLCVAAAYFYRLHA